MSTRELIIEELQSIPEPQLGEVLNMLKAIKSRHQNPSLETYLLSEATLAQDWMKPEEDEAWQNL
jgi:hypothetical protein